MVGVGFCYGGLGIAISDKTSEIVQLGYLSTTVAGMAFGILCITVAALCSMLGPGLALRGGEGAVSMHKAVDTMASEATNCFKFFLAQLLFFHLSSFLLMWVLYSKTVALITNFILGAFMILFIRNGVDIYNQLMISDEEAASGKFSKFDHFESMGDLDRGNSQVTPQFNTMRSPESQNSGIGQVRQGNAGGKPSSFIGNSGAAMD